jgi:hypothetical protein
MLSDFSTSDLLQIEVICDLPPPPSEFWVSSTLTEENLKDMEERGILSENAISGWKCCFGQ